MKDLNAVPLHYMEKPNFDTQKYANSTDYMIDLLTTSAQPATASTGNAYP